MYCELALRPPRLLTACCGALLSVACFCSSVRAAGSTYQVTTTAATTTGNWSTAGWTGGPNAYPTTTDAGNVAQTLGPANTTSTLSLTLDVPATIGALYVASQGTTVANWTISSDGNATHFLTMDATGLPVGSTPGAPYAAGVAVIASRSGGTLTVNPNVVMNTSLDIGGTSPQTPSGVTINGSITSAATATTALTFRGQGSTAQSNIVSVLTVNGNVGASGSNIALSNLRTSSAGTAGSVVINGNLGPSVTTVTQNSVAPMTLAGTNTYSGTTTVTAGTLQIRNGSAIPNASAVNLGLASSTASSGVLSVVGGSKEGAGATVNGGTVSGMSTVGLGALTLSSNSTLDFDSASNGNALVFASGFTANGFKLAVTNWTNVDYNGTTNSGLGTDDRLIFNQNMSSYLSAFDFGGGAGVGVSQIALGGGFYELGFSPVPEPATWAGGLLLCAAATVRFRRRLLSEISLTVVRKLLTLTSMGDK